MMTLIKLRQPVELLACYFPLKARFIFVAALVGANACYAQAPAPSMGGRLGQGTFVSSDFILNLQVQVHAPDGSPLRSVAVVTLYALSGLPISTATTKGAQARFTQLAPGPYYVEVEAAGYGRTKEDTVVQPSLAENLLTISLVPASFGASHAVYSHTPLLEPYAQKDLKKAVELLKGGKLESAQKVLKGVAKKQPNHPDVLYVVGMLAEKRGDTDAARSSWEKAISDDPTHLQALYALGQSYLRRGDYSKAEDLGRRGLDLDPNSWKEHSLLSSAAFRQGRYAEAVAHGERALELGKDKAADISIVLAQALAVQGRTKEAKEVLSAYLASKPGGDRAEVAQRLLTRMQSGADRFVINGVDAEPDPDIPEPSLSPLVEHWLPPNVDQAAAPVEPGASCDLKDVLERAGEQLQRVPETLDRFSATETVEHQSVNESGIASKARTFSFAYVVSIHETQRGHLNVEEYRNGKDDESVFPDHFATRGLPSQIFIFHPYYQGDFEMNCEGLARQSGGFAWQVRFEQKKNSISRIQVHYVNDKRFAVPLKGRAWVSAVNFQVVHLETDLRESVKAAGLYAQHTDIEYGPVLFQKDKQELWLPIRADFYLQTRGHRLHRRHDFHDYMLFAIEDKQNIGKPKTLAEPQ
jgi:tetratricopeptide (TPR) repeat protein